MTGFGSFDGTSNNGINWFGVLNGSNTDDMNGFDPFGLASISSPPAPYANNRGPPFTCNQAGCNSAFKRKADCERHMLKHAAPQLPCTVQGCTKQYYRKDKLVDHRRKRHGLPN